MVFSQIPSINQECMRSVTHGQSAYWERKQTSRQIHRYQCPSVPHIYSKLVHFICFHPWKTAIPPDIVRLYPSSTKQTYYLLWSFWKMWYIPLLVLGVGADLNARTNNTTIDEKADIIVKSDILRPSGRLLNVFNVVRWCSYISNNSDYRFIGVLYWPSQN